MNNKVLNPKYYCFSDEGTASELFDQCSKSLLVFHFSIQLYVRNGYNYVNFFIKSLLIVNKYFTNKYPP